jgi:hypothetical protein
MRNGEKDFPLNSELLMEDVDGSQEGSEEGTKNREKSGSH